MSWKETKARLEQDAEECENGNEYVIDGEKQTKAFAADIRAALQRMEELEEMGRAWQSSDEHKNANALRQRVEELERDNRRRYDILQTFGEEDLAECERLVLAAEKQVEELEIACRENELAERLAARRAEAAEAKLAQVVALVAEADRLYNDIDAEGSVADTLRAALAAAKRESSRVPDEVYATGEWREGEW